MIPHMKKEQMERNGIQLTVLQVTPMVVDLLEEHDNLMMEDTSDDDEKKR